MAASGSSMLYSFLLFVATLSLQEMYRVKLASSELFTILGGFTSSLIFLMLLTFIGNYQETCGIRTGWGAVIFAEAVALIAASTVHRVCITTWDRSHIPGSSFTIGLATGHEILIYLMNCFTGILGLAMNFDFIFLFSTGLLYEINKLSGMMLSKSESKSKRY